MGDKLPLQIVLSIAISVALGLMELHGARIIYEDLKLVSMATVGREGRLGGVRGWWVVPNVRMRGICPRAA